MENKNRKFSAVLISMLIVLVLYFHVGYCSAAVARRSLQFSSSIDFSKATVVIVSQKKGEGHFTTIQDAIDAVPGNNQKLMLIRIRPGVYREKVTIPGNKPYIILTGASATNTIISYNDSANSTGGTFYCATVTVFASDFTARFLTIQNTYGPGDQAVAVRVSGDRAAFYGCRFLGFQDTVLDESGRHYFKNCYIEGAADFICGDGQSLYEKCHLHTIPELNGAITAQRRSSPGEDTGYTFLNSKITGKGYMYLGRAWGRYSRVVFAYTYIEDIIFSQGWDNWKDPTREKTVFFAQYKCFGPGAKSNKRVKWALELNDTEAKPFLSNAFVEGGSWLRELPTALEKASRILPSIT